MRSAVRPRRHSAPRPRHASRSHQGGQSPNGSCSQPRPRPRPARRVGTRRQRDWRRISTPLAALTGSLLIAAFFRVETPARPPAHSQPQPNLAGALITSVRCSKSARKAARRRLLDRTQPLRGGPGGSDRRRVASRIFLPRWPRLVLSSTHASSRVRSERIGGVAQSHPSRLAS